MIMRVNLILQLQSKIFLTVSIELIQLIRAYALPDMQFLVNTIYPHLVNTIYSTIHIIPTTIPHKILSYSIQLYRYYNTVIHCNYIVTILITTLYSYIYRYNLSIKRYNNQYRYKHIYSIIRIILNNIEMNIYTVYSLHNIQ